jgi:Flp pilus assembly protein TadG
MDVRSTWEMLWRFHRNESGNVAMMFGLALIPLLGLAGVAIDYSNATRTQSRSGKKLSRSNRL